MKKTDYNAKITKSEGTIPSITGLATTAALTAVKNKILDVSNLVKEKDYDGKIWDIKSKNFTMVDYNKTDSQTLDAKIKQKKLVDKSAIAGFINNPDFNEKIATIATKAELKTEQDKIIKLQLLDHPSYFCNKNHFEYDGTQNNSVLHLIYRYFKKISNTANISSWKSKGLSSESMMKAFCYIY